MKTKKANLILVLLILFAAFVCTTGVASAISLSDKYVGNTVVDLEWDKYGSTDFSCYKINRGGSTIATISDRDTTFYRDTGLSKGVTYGYSIRVYNRTGERKGGDSVAATTGEVRGTITRDTTWTAATSLYTQSKYYNFGRGRVEVSNGATLTIEPGVTVNVAYMQYGSSITVYGTLRADGALFQLQPSNYHCTIIRFSHSKDSVIKNCVFDFGKHYLKGETAISADRCDNLQIIGNSLKYTVHHYEHVPYSSYIIFINSSDNSIISDNTVTALDYTRGIMLYGEGRNNLIARNNISVESSYGGYCIELCGSDNTITENTIWGGDILVYPNPSTEEGCTSDNTITYNTITGGRIAGLQGRHNNSVISHNKIMDGVDIGYSSITWYGSNNIITSNTVSNSSSIYVNFGSNNVITNNVVSNGSGGISCSTDNTIIEDNNLVSNERYGISLSASNCVIEGNTVLNNSGYYPCGISVSGSSNLIYNNYLNNTKNAGSSGNNKWNITKTPGTNIVGGRYLGGNYWSDYTGTDADGDGLGDTPYDIEGSGANKDYLPLFKFTPALTVSAGPLNPDQYVWADTPNLPAIHITLSATTEDDIKVEQVTFHASGSGNDRMDIKEARLYLGDASGELLGTRTYHKDNGAISFTVNKIIPAGSSINLLLVYEFDVKKACPCHDYSTKISITDISAKPVHKPKLDNPPPFSGPVTERIGIKFGEIKIVSGDAQWGLKGEPLPAPMKVEVEHQTPECIDCIRFSISEGAEYGAKLSNGKTEHEVKVDASGMAEETLTLGDELGENLYWVHATLISKDSDCYTPPFEIFKESASGAEVTVTAQHDGTDAGDDEVSMFIHGIKAPNKFTAVIEMVPDDFATVDKVTFDLAGDVKVDTAEPYEATFDMAKLSTKTLTVTAEMTTKDGETVYEDKELTLVAIPFPGWFSTMPKISQSFKSEFYSKEEKYHVGFTYPVDFDWEEAIPGSVLLLGGEEHEADTSFTVGADYFITQKSSFSGEGSLTTKVFSSEISGEASLNGNFNENFAFQGGSGTFEVDFPPFDLPEKGSSKTFVVYGVPITVAVDLGGNVQVYVEGSAVLDHQLEFEQMSVTPGTVITGQVTVSVSAVFGLAKVSGIGEPQVVMEITITYKTKEGTDAVFGGQVVVPVKLVGSIFWGAGSAELCSGEFGPYTFGSMAGSEAASVSYLRESSPEYEIPDLISTSCLVIDSSGRQMLVWIADTDSKEGSPNPDVYYRYYNGASWSSSAPIIGAASPDELWEMDPVVVFLSDGDALAAWTSNDGSHDLDNLNDIFAAQDIVYSVWDASSASWTAPKHVTDDAEADGIVSLSYDAENDRVIAAWVHDRNSDRDISTRTEWEIYYSIWDRSADNWTEARALTGDGADFMPAIASDTRGNTFALWVNDDDGAFFEELGEVSGGSNVDYTNLDCEIYYSKWDGSSWTAPEEITENNNETESTPAVAFAASNGDAIAVWVGKQGTSDKLYYSIYRASEDSWSSPALINESDYFIEEPKVVVNSVDVATVTWRGYDGYDGDLFSSSIDLTASSWSAPKQITRDDKVDWYITTAIGSNDEVMASWTKNDFASKEDLSSPDLSDNVNFAQTDVSSAYLTGVYSDNGTYTDGGGLYDYLTVTAEAYIKTAGNYGIIAELYNNSIKIAEARDSATGLSTGTYTFTLNFPGGYISERGVNGSYSLKNVVLLDENKSPVQTDFASAPYSTSPYTADQFVKGAVSFDAAEYKGALTALITVKDSDMNKDSSATEIVSVRVTSTVDPRGIGVILNETEVDSGIFTGSIGFDTLKSDDTTDKIYVVDYTTIFVTYTDTVNYIWSDSALWRIMPPNITSFAPESPVNDTVCNWRTFNVTVNQTVNVSWYLNNVLLFTNESVREANCTLHAEVAGEHNVSAIASNENGTDMQTWVWNVTEGGKQCGPTITSFAPLSPVNDTVCNWRTFNVTVDQTVNVSWYLNDVLLFTNESVREADCTLHAEIAGEHSVSANASNSDGMAMQTWIWNVTDAPTPSPTAYRGGSGVAHSRDLDGDGISNRDEMLAGTDPNDPCDPNLECPACIAIRPQTPTPLPTTTPTISPLATPTPSPPPEVTLTPTPPQGKVPGFGAVFAIVGLLAVAYILLRRRSW